VMRGRRPWRQEWPAMSVSMRSPEAVLGDGQRMQGRGAGSVEDVGEASWKPKRTGIVSRASIPPAGMEQQQQLGQGRRGETGESGGVG
jgi:hypothetical protein